MAKSNIVTRFKFDLDSIKKFQKEVERVRSLFSVQPLKKERVPMKELKVIEGAHPYSDECHCMSCADWRARDGKGTRSIARGLKPKDLDLDAIRAETRAFEKHNPSGLMPIMADIILDLCDLAENEGLNPDAAYWRGEYEKTVKAARAACFKCAKPNDVGNGDAPMKITENAAGKKMVEVAGEMTQDQCPLDVYNWLYRRYHGC